MAYTLEKKILSEFIQMYKDLPCLWNTSHAFYSNKVARNRAIEVLLEKYKTLDSMADKSRVKKKIENMRTCYKRERTKVVKSQYSGGELYEPSLWYYSEMSFLDELEPDYNETTILTETVVDDHDADADDDEERSKSPPAKRPKPTSIYVTESENEYIETMKNSPAVKKAKKSSIYIAEDDNVYQEEQVYSIKNEPSDSLYLGSTSESNLFGRTISAQLSELRPKQRFIAEKLISEVIFFGRLDKLKTGTTINLNDDRF